MFLKLDLIKNKMWGMVAHTFNSSNPQAKVDRPIPVSSRTARLYNKTLSQKKVGGDNVGAVDQW